MKPAILKSDVCKIFRESNEDGREYKNTTQPSPDMLCMAQVCFVGFDYRESLSHSKHIHGQHVGLRDVGGPCVLWKSDISLRIHGNTHTC